MEEDRYEIYVNGEGEWVNLEDVRKLEKEIKLLKTDKMVLGAAIMHLAGDEKIATRVVQLLVELADGIAALAKKSEQTDKNGPECQ